MSQPTSSLARQIVITTFCKLLLNIGRRFMYPFAPELSRALNVPLTAITTIIATSQCTSLIGIVTGPFADWCGYRRVMKAGLLLLVLGMIVCGTTSWYWLAFVGLLLVSLGKILFDPALQAYLGRQVDFSRRGRAIGFTETAWAGSTLFGIPLLGVAIQYLGLNAAFLLLAVLGMVGLVALLHTLPKSTTNSTPERPPHRPPLALASIRALVTSRPARGMLMFSYCISIANDSLFVIYGVWFEQQFHVSLVTLGFSTVAIGLAELLGESGTAFLSDRIGLKRAILLGMALTSGAYLLLPALGISLFGAMTGLFLIFLFNEFTMVTSFSLGTEVLPGSRATMLAGYFSIGGIGRMCGVLVGGMLWQQWGILGICLFASVLTLTGLLLFAWGLHDWKPESASD